MIIEIIDDQTMHPDMGTHNVPVRVMTFRVVGDAALKEYTVQGKTIEELKETAITAVKNAKKVYPQMEI